VRELRRYRALFDQASTARDDHELARVASRTDQKIHHWLLAESMKDKILERAIKIGVPCRKERDRCFAYLIDLSKPQGEMFVVGGESAP
jgi:hypothetical protein